MRHRIAVEEMEPNHWIAWVLELPGCYSNFLLVLCDLCVPLLLRMSRHLDHAAQP